MWNKIKFLLGMKCVIGINGRWYVTKRTMFRRFAQDKEDGHWWHCEEYWVKYCAYATKQEAVESLNKFDIQF